MRNKLQKYLITYLNQHVKFNCLYKYENFVKIFSAASPKECSCYENCDASNFKSPRRNEGNILQVFYFRMLTFY